MREGDTAEYRNSYGFSFWCLYDPIIFEQVYPDPFNGTDAINRPSGNTILIPFRLIGVFTVLFLT